MIYELKQDKFTLSKESPIKLHPEIIEILFENQRHIKSIFVNLKGLYGITHMSMACIDPNHELVAFSTKPNIEYNLFNQCLWLNDHCYGLEQTNKNSLLWWDYENEKIEKIKLINNHFTIGMSIFRPIADFRFIYSFATNEKNHNLYKYYNDNIFGLIDMGDYFYKSLRGLYSRYAIKYAPPKLDEFNSKATCLDIGPFLRLVRNNK